MIMLAVFLHERDIRWLDIASNESTPYEPANQWLTQLAQSTYPQQQAVTAFLGSLLE